MKPIIKSLLNELDLNWKKHVTTFLITFSILLIGILIGMFATNIDSIKQILINTISGMLDNLQWLIIFFIGFKIIGVEIKQGVKNIPLWIEQYDKIKMKHYRIGEARVSR